MTTSSFTTDTTRHHTSPGRDLEYAIRPQGATALLELDGVLSSGWAGSLASALTLQDISIIRGSAVKTSALKWSARFEIKPRSVRPEGLASLDVPSIFGKPADYKSAPTISLKDYHLEVSPRHGGSLYARIVGADKIGFLVGILRQLSFFSLFPVEMKLETEGLTASDHFWLKRIGNVQPTSEDIANIQESLFGLLSA
ncbi:hypothetical protein FO488_02830 [Geobacter sp. FeAm09]|uniref:hypothetical protein n=1 Tax=Geobacter sp. FeAm09 TaxID=2597769 RepID=UPI0011EDFA7B|nr:hypothetical protein [Geobacter sp. FeAm09]QEM67198.1 hypothetical protein FO488_02830 [Geobacter sp. FeAm09]